MWSRGENNHMGLINDVKVSEHFRASEFECHGKLCCGYTVKLHPDLIAMLELIRATAIVQTLADGRSLRALLIRSGYRCIQHNKDVGGKHSSNDPLDPDNSFHTFGIAADIAPRGISKQRLAEVCRGLIEHNSAAFRVGFYTREGSNILHVDIGHKRKPHLPRVFGDLW
jgi:hypothetical protein